MGAAGAVSGSSIAVPTGPAVGPGSVGFGATSVPLPGYGTTGIGVGGSGLAGPIPMRVPLYQNVEVLSALVRLTGRDFGYDRAAWRNWLNTSFRPIRTRPSGPAALNPK